VERDYDIALPGAVSFCGEPSSESMSKANQFPVVGFDEQDLNF
jgi:hypothetical protein